MDYKKYSKETIRKRVIQSKFRSCKLIDNFSLPFENEVALRFVKNMIKDMRKKYKETKSLKECELSNLKKLTNLINRNKKYYIKEEE